MTFRLRCIVCGSFIGDNDEWCPKCKADSSKWESIDTRSKLRKQIVAKEQATLG